MGIPLEDSIKKIQAILASWRPNYLMLTSGGQITLHSHGAGSHSHANLALLDTYSQTETNLADAVSKKHVEAHNHSGVYEPANANIQTHVTSQHAPSNAQKNSDILKSEIEAVLTGQISTHTHAGGSTPAWYGVLYSNMNDCNPLESIREWTMGAIAGPTPTQISTSIARCVMFTPPANLTINKIRLFGVGATTNLYKFAIYPVGTSTSKLWESGTASSAINTWLNISASLPITVNANTQYWFCVTVAGTGTTAGFRSMPAPLGTNFWGANNTPLGNRNLSLHVYTQFAVASGAFPATLPSIVAAAYANGTTGSVPLALLDNST